MTDHSDDPREVGSPRPQEDESSKPIESPDTDAAASAPPPMARPVSPLSPPHVPPMLPTEVAKDSVPSAWPTVVGILAIVFGCFGFLACSWVLVYPFVTDQLEDMAQQIPMQVTIEPFTATVWTTAISITWFMCSGLLLFGGISLVRRRRRAAATLLVWAILEIVLILASAGVESAAQTPVVDQATTQQPTVPREITITVGCGALGPYGGIIFDLAVPVFVLVWFRRSAIKKEVAAWR